MQINISDKVEKKLREEHDGVTKKEVYECFLNMDGKALKDNREQNKTTPRLMVCSRNEQRQKTKNMHNHKRWGAPHKNCV